MKTLTNKNFQKLRKNKIRGIIFSILLIVLSFVFCFWGAQISEEVDKKTTDLNSIIISSQEKENKKAYLDVKVIPYQFAVQEGNENSYYIVSDGTYLYVLYMGPNDYRKLNNKSISEKAIRVEGITQVTTEEIKKLAIDAYNKSITDTSKKLSLNDYNDYFGSVHLDLTRDSSSVATIQYLLFFIFFILGLIVFLTIIISYIKMNRAIKKMDGTKIDELDHEMNDKNAFYYEKTHLYLTEHYIINLGGT